MAPRAAAPCATRTSACDLHVHSKYSDRPSEWILRRLGSPESFMDPKEIYRRCKERGMRFVTITDHNSIAGALEIAEYPDTFLSAEVTTYFPEDGCKIHCLVWGVTEAQFAEIDAVRENIYKLRDFLVRGRIAHAIAHPLFRVNSRLTVEHVEKLILLFNNFEGVNGSRHPRASELARVVLGNLTPAVIADLVAKHGIAPVLPEPWRKSFTGGSDDHSGCYPAQGFTVTPHAATVQEFLGHLRDGRHEPGGSCGTSLKFAHSLYAIAYQYYRQRVLRGKAGEGSPLGALLRHLVEGSPRPNSVRGALGHLAGRIFGRRRQTATEALLLREFASLASDSAESAPEETIDNQRAFEFACRVGQQLGYAFLKRFAGHVRKGELLESLEAVSALVPVVLGVSPYLASFASQHKDEAFLQVIAAHFPAAHGMIDVGERKAWVTDVFGDGNGTSRTIQAMAEAARKAGRGLVIVTCQEKSPKVTVPLKNFKPVGTFSLPEWEMREAVFPPFLEMLQYFEQERFSEIVISTPGPVGVAALAAGRLLGLRVTGVCHTDLPLSALQLTQDDIMENLAWRYMRWFFGQLDSVFVPSHAYRRKLAERGLEEEKLVVLPGGVNLGQFSLRECSPAFWGDYGVPKDGFRYLCAGRVAAEMNLDGLLLAFQDLRHRRTGDSLIIVGDGPHLPALQEQWGAADGVFFTGALEGQELVQAYSSADAFVFPGTDDTCGTVVLEAQACGLPVIVADRGGPCEIVSRNHSGLVVDVARPGLLARAMERLAVDAGLRAVLSSRGLENARASEWTASMELLWRAADEGRKRETGRGGHLAIQPDPAAGRAMNVA